MRDLKDRRIALPDGRVGEIIEVDKKPKNIWFSYPEDIKKMLQEFDEITEEKKEHKRVKYMRDILIQRSKTKYYQCERIEDFRRKTKELLEELPNYE